MKKLLFLGLILAMLVSAYAIAVAAEAPGDVTMTYPADGAKYAPIVFSHDKHAAQACEDCHHKMAENPDMKCTTCHSNTADKKSDDSFDKAFHDRKSVHSCVGCHKSMKSGPTKCNDCHTK